MCFAVAYGTQRTLLLHTDGWRYASEGWGAVYIPISETCWDLPEGECVFVCMWEGVCVSCVVLLVWLYKKHCVCGRAHVLIFIRIVVPI